MNSYPSETGCHGNALSSSRPHFSQLQNSSHTSNTNTFDSGYVAMQNRTAGCCSSESPSTSYCPFNQSSVTTFQLGNSLNSAIGSSNSGMPIAIQAAGVSTTATSSAVDQSTSNQPSGLANHPHAYAQMHNHGALDNQIAVPTMQTPTRQTQNQSHASFPVQPDLRSTDYRTLNEQLNDSNFNYFGIQPTTTATLPIHQFQNPTAAAYSSQPDQSHFGTLMYSNELSEDRHVASRPSNDTKLEGIDHARDNSSSEINVRFALVGNYTGNIMIGELENAFDSDSN